MSARLIWRMILFALGIHCSKGAENAAHGTPSRSAVVKPTGETLQKWLNGKDVVEVCFAGPHMEPLKLKDSLHAKGLDNPLDETFLLTPGEGGGENRAFVTVHMIVSTKNLQRLLSLQKELVLRGYALDPEQTHVWSFQCAPHIHQQARVLVSKFLREVTLQIEKAIPGAKVSEENIRLLECLGAIKYAVPETPIVGDVQVYPITVRKHWELQTPTDQRFHLPHLGLMITAYYRPQQAGASDDKSAEHMSVRKAIKRAIEPLMKLDGGESGFDAK